MSRKSDEIRGLFSRSTKTKKLATSSSVAQVGREIESPGYVKSFLQDKDRFFPDVDFSDPANFAKFGSAEQYYVKAIENIYKFYPYDGSQKERLDWHNSSSYFDNYVFENEYPRTNGLIEVGETWGSAATTINLTSIGQSIVKKSDAPQYISIKGGPHGPAIPAYASGSSYEKGLSYKFKDQKSNVYDESIQQEQNLTIDGAKGNTVEFWLQLPTEPSKSQASPSHAYFDLWNENFNFAGGSSLTYGRTILETIFDVDGSGDPDGSYLNDSIFYVTYTSGSSGVQRAKIGPTSLSGNLGIDLSDWNHYSFVMQNNPTGSNHLLLKLYINGNLADTVHTGSQIANVGTLPLNATLGAYRTGPTPAAYTAGVNSEGFGTLSGSSIDEFRFWKSARSSQQIGRNWFTQVGGGTNTDYGTTESKFTGSENPVDLGVYYKFNEGITLTSSLDRVTLDYSGRISNGFINNYTAAMRSTSSAMVLSNAAEREFKDPVIYSNHPDVNEYEQSASIKGREYDGRNSSYMYNTLPTWVIDQDQDKQRNTTLALNQIIASYFDELALQIDKVPELKNLGYISGSISGSVNKSLPFADRLLTNSGFVAPEIFADADVLEALANRDDDREFEKKLSDVKNQIYTNIYNNLLFINKSKGTEKAIRNLIRCYGVDDSLYSLNMYADNAIIDLADSSRPKVVRKSYANFNDLQNFNATVYQHPISSNANSVSYITGSTKINLDGFDSQIGSTLEAEVIFPKKPSPSSKGYSDKEFSFMSASLFGMHTAVATSTDYAWAANDYANFQVYAVKASTSQPPSKDVFFMLSSSNVNSSTEGIFTALTSSVYKEVYENQKWNFAVKVRPERYPNSRRISGSSGGIGYIAEFFGVCTFGDQIINQFHLTGAISSTNGINFSTSRKRIYAGAHRTNFSGSSIVQTDAKISSCRYWTLPLDNEEIISHAMDAKNYGVFNTMQSSFLLQNQSAFPKDIPKIATLALHWDFDTITGSNASGQFEVQDFSSGSSDGRYGTELSTLLFKQHTGRGDFFPVSSTGSISREYISTYRQQVPENLNSYTSVNILNRDDELFTRRTKPVKFTYSVEKSMYQTISEEMINFIAAASDASALETLIGDPINKYRQNYKALEKIRSIFFERIGNTPDLDKYLDYFKWLDSSVSEMVQRLAPASSKITDVANVVESHLFERGGKYTHPFPTMHFGSNEPTGIIKGINELLYDWEFGHAPNPGPFLPAQSTILFLSDTANYYGSSRITIVSTNGTSKRYIFDISGSPSTGGLDGSDIVVQVNGLSNRDDIADQLIAAINSSNGHNAGSSNSVINLSYVDATNTLTMTQVTLGIGGNTPIVQALSNPVMTINDFSGGSGFISRRDFLAFGAQSINCNWWNKKALRSESYLTVGDSGVDTDRMNIHSASLQVFNRNFNKPYKIGAMEGGGIIKRETNVRSFVMTETPPLDSSRGLAYNTSTFASASDCTDLDKINPNRKYKTDYQVKYRNNATEFLSGKLVGNYQFVSSSQGTDNASIPEGYIVSTEHLRDYYSFTKDTPIQGPFTEQHVGGNSYRHVGLNTGVSSTRQEAYYTLATFSGGHIFYNIVNPSSINVHAPRADYTRDFIAKSPVNIKNILTNTSSLQNELGAALSIGNYVNNYEIVQIPGRDINNRYLVENNGITTTFASSSFVYGLQDFEVPDRGRHASIMVSRFSAPGGPEVNSPAYMDVESETFSVYNVLPFRNLTVRQPLNTLLTRHSAYGGYDSVLGSPSASYQKTQRNGAKKIEYSEARVYGTAEAVVTASAYDNYWVQHMIPQSDLQYAWITASAISGPFGYSKKDFTNAGGASTDIAFVSASELGLLRVTSSNFFSITAEQSRPSYADFIAQDFAGLNIVTVASEDGFANNTITLAANPTFAPITNYISGNAPPSSAGASLLNVSLLKNNGPYQHPSWKQVRQSNNPIVRYHKKNNILSLLDTKTVMKPGEPDNIITQKTVLNYTEPPVSFKYKPLEHEFVLESGETINIESTYSNNLATFTDQKIDKRIINFDGAKKGEQVYDDLKQIYINEKIDPIYSPFAIREDGRNDFLSMKYSEAVYPRERNTGLSKVRGRENYTVSSGSTNFNARMGSSIAFWKDNINDRLRTADGTGAAINAEGVPIMSGSAYYSLLDLSIWPLDAEEPFFDLECHSASAGLSGIAGFDPIYWSPLGPSGAQLNPASEPRWNDVTKNGELSYAGWIYTLLQPQIQGKVRIDDAPTGSGPLEVKNAAAYLGAKPSASMQYEFPNMIWSGSFNYGQSTPAGAVSRAFFKHNSLIRMSASLHLIPPYRADVLSGRRPWFDSYEEYAQDIRLMAKDHTIIPEFRISEHIDYYLDKGYESGNNKFMTLVGASLANTASSESEVGIPNNDFYKVYSHTDFMKYFNVLKTDHLTKTGGVPGAGGFPAKQAGKFTKIKLECEGIKKLLPYQGFYPALRAVQLGHLFSSSYAPHIVGSSVRDGDMERLAALYQPFFAPGIFFNTIKSGIAVDYSVHTGSFPSIGIDATFIDVTSSFSGATFPMSVLADGPNYAFPFESILVPDRYIPISSSDIGPDPTVPSASVYFVYPHFTGSIRGKGTLNPSPTVDCYFADEKRSIAEQGSGTGSSPQIYFEWTGQSEVKYSLAANNFFAEVENLFLENKAPTSFVSRAEKDFKPMTSGSSYFMDVLLYKTDDFISYEGPSGSFDFEPGGGENGLSLARLSSLGDLKMSAFARATITTATGFGNAKTIILTDSDGTTHIFTTDSGLTLGAGGNPSYSGTGKIGTSGVSSANDFATAVSVAVTGSSASGATGFTLDAAASNNIVVVKSDLIGARGNQPGGNRKTLDGATTITDFVNGRRGESPVSARGMHYGPAYQPGSLKYGSSGTSSLPRQEAWNEDPSYAIHTPPYFYGDAVARIEFKPHEVRDMSSGESAKFTLQEILSNAEVNTAYSNNNRRAKSLQNPAVKNGYPVGVSQMQISSSVNLFGQITLKEVQYKNQKDAAGNYIPESATTPVLQDSQDAWVVETKFECPSINLYDMDTAALGAGIGLGKEKHFTRGIWKGYGRPTSGSSGVFLQIKESYAAKTYGRGTDTDLNPTVATPRTGSLIDVCGFKADQQRVGELASKREISEAIVAIPISSKGQPYAIDLATYQKQILNVKQGKSPVVAGMLGSDKDIEETSISKMYNSMQKYYIPPHMDFAQQENVFQMDIKPFVMYIFEFTHNLTKEDLSNIWQNLMPDISMKAEKQKSVLEHEIGPKYEFFGNLNSNDFPSDIRWKVFKVKKRARNNYFNITKTSELGNGFAFASQTELAGFSSNPEAELDHSYNWPYDFCSLVELAKINSEATFEPEE